MRNLLLLVFNALEKRVYLLGLLYSRYLKFWLLNSTCLLFALFILRRFVQIFQKI
jgi:hypothetical protein